MKAYTLAWLIPCAVLVACSRAETPPAAPAVTSAPTTQPTPPATALATLTAAAGGAVKGELHLTAGPGSGVAITGEFSGLPASTVHGFHIHESGDCSAADFKSAGEHFNPTMARHGGPIATDRHIGDLPNIEADKLGKSTINAMITGASLRDGGPSDLLGKAVILHAKRDDYVTQPAGDSGDRIACGVVQ